MRRRVPPIRTLRGFTLLEVLVALVVVALGMSALLEVLNQSANNVMALRNKTVAEWIAMNQIALARLSLTAPRTGTTQGDVQNCAHGNWHWQQQISAVDAVPGLLTITVHVRRTGSATPNPNQNHPAQPPGATPGATGPLGGNVTLGPTAQLGTVSSLSTAGCASFRAPGSSLDGGNGPELGSMPSLGATSLGSSSTAASVGSSIGASIANAVTGSSGNADASASPGVGAGGSDNGNGSDARGTNSWLVTVTGFRGNSLGAPAGESPSWVNITGFPTTGNGANPATSVSPGLNEGRP
ncbi:MAG TPA: type II secretion system minor pseudopilin GspI [Steroidobacteraceae bacterium]|nr:type II secretion system minor pseudopilin GspI [Steroidobacteraceae bacterium]